MTHNKTQQKDHTIQKTPQNNNIKQQKITQFINNQNTKKNTTNSTTHNNTDNTTNTTNINYIYQPKNKRKQLSASQGSQVSCSALSWRFSNVSQDEPLAH